MRSIESHKIIVVSFNVFVGKTILLLEKKTVLFLTSKLMMLLIGLAEAIVHRKSKINKTDDEGKAQEKSKNKYRQLCRELYGRRGHSGKAYHC